MFCELWILTAGGYCSWYMFYLEIYGQIYISNVLIKKNTYTKPSKLKPKARALCLLWMKLEHLAIYLSFCQIWDFTKLKVLCNFKDSAV